MCAYMRACVWVCGCRCVYLYVYVGMCDFGSLAARPKHRIQRDETTTLGYVKMPLFTSVVNIWTEQNDTMYKC